MRGSSLALLVLVGACGGGAVSSGASPVAGTAPTAVRSLRIVPRDAAVCPGANIVTRYEVTGADGKVTALDRSGLSLLNRSAVAAEPRPNGDWETTSHPLASIVSGFALKAVLKSDTSVRAQTTVAPSYACLTSTFNLRTQGETPNAHVRLGVFRTPFYDSVVVGLLEGVGAPRIIVLGPKELHRGAIKIDASGSPGAPGRNGAPGRDGSACSSGERGNDGSDGQPGSPGGEVNIIVEAGATWLEELVVVANPGGPGGQGGAGGAGGRPGPTQQGGSATRCGTSPGQRGVTGRSGPPGGAGPAPRTTTIPNPLLWSGSPLWSDSTARRVLITLMADTTKK